MCLVLQIYVHWFELLEFASDQDAGSHLPRRCRLAALKIARGAVRTVPGQMSADESSLFFRVLDHENAAAVGKRLLHGTHECGVTASYC